VRKRPSWKSVHTVSANVAENAGKPMWTCLRGTWAGCLDKSILPLIN
jgi:hypothetical protein